MTLNDYALAKREVQAVLISVSVATDEKILGADLSVEPERNQRKTSVSVRLTAFYSLLIKRPVFSVVKRQSRAFVYPE